MLVCNTDRNILFHTPELGHIGGSWGVFFDFHPWRLTMDSAREAWWNSANTHGFGVCRPGLAPNCTTSVLGQLIFFETQSPYLWSGYNGHPPSFRLTDTFYKFKGLSLILLIIKCKIITKLKTSMCLVLNTASHASFKRFVILEKLLIFLWFSFLF